MHGINAPEFFDKAVFSAFITSLKENSYFTDDGKADTKKLLDLSTILNRIVSAEINLTIQSAVEKSEDSSNDDKEDSKVEDNA